MALSTLSMKLLVDTKAGRVLYAEASRDAVYFLFSLLTLPILEEDLVDGSIGNLYLSFKKLDGDENNIAPFPPTPGENCATYDLVRQHMGLSSRGAGGAAAAARQFRGGHQTSYVVMDDLTVVPASGISGAAVFNTLRVRDLDALEEKTVQLRST